MNSMTMQGWGDHVKWQGGQGGVEGGRGLSLLPQPGEGRGGAGRGEQDLRAGLREACLAKPELLSTDEQR